MPYLALNIVLSATTQRDDQLLEILGDVQRTLNRLVMRSSTHEIQYQSETPFEGRPYTYTRREADPERRAEYHLAIETISTERSAALFADLESRSGDGVSE